MKLQINRFNRNLYQTAEHHEGFWLLLKRSQCESESVWDSPRCSVTLTAGFLINLHTLNCITVLLIHCSVSTLKYPSTEQERRLVAGTAAKDASTHYWIQNWTLYWTEEEISASDSNKLCSLMCKNWNYIYSKSNLQHNTVCIKNRGANTFWTQCVWLYTYD